MNTYQIAYSLNNIFMTYVVYRMMILFYDKRRISKRLEFLSYTLYGIIFNLTIFFDVPPITYIIMSLTSFFLLTYLYQGSLFKRFLSTLLMYIILITIELSINYATGYYITDLSDPMLFESTVGITLISILTFIAVLLLGSFKNLKLGVSIPWYYWLSILLIPGGTIIMLISIVTAVEETNDGLIIIDLSITLFINAIVFYMYDRILLLSQRDIEYSLMAQQNKFYRQQFDIMQESSQRTKAIRHDLKNHLSAIGQMVKHNEIEKTMQYIDHTLGQVDYEAEISSTGNLVLDSMVNYKLHDIARNGVKLNYKAVLPPNLPMNDFDFTIILGNIFDNAIESLEYVAATQRFLDISIRYDRNRLIITVRNSFDGRVEKENGRLHTRKISEDNHGIGLRNVESIVEKYNGVLKINHDSNFFTVEILLFFDAEPDT